MADPPRRVNFVDGLVLTAADLVAEQEYHRRMRYLHNRLHGHGVVDGLEVTVAGGLVNVTPGLGIDAQGREVVATEPLVVALGPRRGARPWARDVVVTWHEELEAPVPGPVGGVEPTRWVERPRASLVACGEAAAEALVLARLTWTGPGVVDVDTSVRRPLRPE